MNNIYLNGFGYMNEPEVRKKYEEITKTLIKRQLSITTMESCTSGILASLLTDTEGSSAVFKGAFITYCNEAKIMRGVPREIIEDYGVYSKETASEMAKAARRAYETDISIGVTGTLGNVDPANNDSRPFEVFFAIMYHGTVASWSVFIEPQRTRYECKLSVADVIGDKLLSLLDS